MHLYPNFPTASYLHFLPQVTAFTIFPSYRSHPCVVGNGCLFFFFFYYHSSLEMKQRKDSGSVFLVSEQKPKIIYLPRSQPTVFMNTQAE